MMLAAAFVQLALAQTTPLAATAEEARLSACIALIDEDAERAYEEGMAWSAETRGLEGHVCAAFALLALDRPFEAGRRLESLALPDGGAATQRAALLHEAGNAYLSAGAEDQAVRAFSRALQLLETGDAARANSFVGRAQAFSLLDRWREAEEDLSAALDLTPESPVALRHRAIARMNQGAFALAEADAQRAAALVPSDIETLLVLGHTREARRTGRPVGDQDGLSLPPLGSPPPSGPAP
jgi:tetratricopeptide (TPR) repeat protein